VKPQETQQMMHLLAEASPRSVFLEVAFLESWVAYHERERRVVKLNMLARSLPFFETEFRWRPRLVSATGAPRPAWGGLVAAVLLAGVLLSAV